MDKQAKDTKKDILDLNVEPFESLNQNFNSNAWHVSKIDVDESHLRTPIQKKQILGGSMSEEELKIRGELESDIERNLEEEIKDGIYHLALRLHRLYQHQKERNAREVSEFGDKKNKTLCEVNISIKMEGGTKIEIKETKKEAPEKGWPRSARSENVQAMLVNGTKKFDWAKSLRSGPGGIPINRKIDRSHQAKMLSNDRGRYVNSNLDNARRNLISASGHRKGNLSINTKVLELGWKC